MVMIIQIGAHSSKSLSLAVKASKHVHWQVAEGLKQMGVQPGSKFASIGQSSEYYWARLLKARVVAEVPNEEVQVFWESDARTQSHLMDVLGQTGAKVVVAKNAPSYASQSNWQRVENTEYYARLL